MGLKALHLDRHARPLIVYATDTITAEAWAILSTCVVIDVFVLMAHMSLTLSYDSWPVLKCKAAHMTATAWSVLPVAVSVALTLLDYHNESWATVYLQKAVHKAFQGPTELTFYGVLTDALLQTIPWAPHVRTLRLVHQGLLSWKTWPIAASKFPSLECLAIQGSNLVFQDFDYFDWTCWPHLTRLDLEDNWTLKHWPHLPPALSELRVARTGLTIPPREYFDLNTLSCTVASSSTCPWKNRISHSKSLVYLEIEGHVNGHENFWQHVGQQLRRVCIDGAFKADLHLVLSRIRAVCGNSIVFAK